MGKEFYFILERRFDNALRFLEKVCTTGNICVTLDRTGNFGSTLSTITLHAFVVSDNVSITIQGTLVNPNARKIGMYEDGVFVAYTYVASSGPCKFAKTSCRVILRA